MKVSKTIPEKKETGRDAVIAELFCEYVKSMEDKPRHTTAAKTEADMYDQFCVGAFPDNVRLQSCFFAGFKTAMKLLDNVALLRGREATVWQA